MACGLVFEHRTVGADHVDVAVHEADVRLRLEHRHLPLELARRPAVVGVEEGDEPAARLADRGVPRPGAPGVLLPHDPDAIAVAGEHVGRVVGRPVVDDEHLVGRPRLREDAVERAGQVGGAVVGRDRSRDAAHAATSS